MKKSTDSEQATAVDAFLECVGRCVAQRWLELQRAGSQGEPPSDQLITQPTVDHPSESNGEDPDGPLPSWYTEEASVAEQPDGSR